MGVIEGNREREVKRARNGRSQAARIPVEFALAGNEAIMRKEGDRLIIEPEKESGLLEWLRAQEPCDEGFADVDEGVLPPEDVDL